MTVWPEYAKVGIPVRISRGFLFIIITMHNKNHIALIVFVLLASLTVNIASTVLAQYGSASSGNVWRTISTVLTTSSDVTLVSSDPVPSSNTEVLAAESDEADLQEAAAEGVSQNVTALAQRTQTETSAAPSRASYHVVVTAYSSTPDQTDSTPFITASGTYVRDGIVAANFLPIGTKVRMPDLYGEKVFTVEDRMNQRFSDRMDIWMPDRSSAQVFGKRYTRIEVL